MILAISNIWHIACHAVTQLIRMKIFYFLIVFVVVILAANFFNLPSEHDIRLDPDKLLISLKGMCIFAIQVFGVIFAITTTALLIPKDIEDRTLYTILSKPVARMHYLFGKLLGVILVVFFAMLIMDVCFMVILKIRAANISGFYQEYLISVAKNPAYIKKEMADLAKHSEWLNIQLSIASIFLKVTIMAGIALLLSTFSTSTLFTIIMAFVIFILGHLQAEARDLYYNSFKGEVPWFLQYLGYAISVFIPDLKLFDFTQAAVDAKLILFKDIVKLLALSFFYCLIYIFSSWFVFRKKEF